MSSYSDAAILALPRHAPERQWRLLAALGMIKPDRGVIHVSRRLICELTSFDPDTIKRATQELAKAGVISYTPGRGRGVRAQYVIHAPSFSELKGGSLPTPLIGPEKGGDQSAIRGVGCSRKGGSVPLVDQVFSERIQPYVPVPPYGHNQRPVPVAPTGAGSLDVLIESENSKPPPPSALTEVQTDVAAASGGGGGLDSFLSRTNSVKEEKRCRCGYVLGSRSCRTTHEHEYRTLLTEYWDEESMHDEFITWLYRSGATQPDKLIPSLHRKGLLGARINAFYYERKAMMSRGQLPW